MTPKIQVAAEVRGLVRRGDLRAVARAVGRSAGRFHLRSDEVTVRVVGEEEIRRLKDTYLGEDHATDVLSFPAPDGGGGDVALCWPVVARQALEGGSTVRDEAVRLVVHALAHLSGHDHGTRREARRMLRAERRALRRMVVTDIPRPYGQGGTRTIG